MVFVFRTLKFVCESVTAIFIKVFGIMNCYAVSLFLFSRSLPYFADHKDDDGGEKEQKAHNLTGGEGFTRDQSTDQIEGRTEILRKAHENKREPVNASGVEKHGKCSNNTAAENEPYFRTLQRSKIRRLQDQQKSKGERCQNQRFHADAQNTVKRDIFLECGIDGPVEGDDQANVREITEGGAADHNTDDGDTECSQLHFCAALLIEHDAESEKQ